MKVSKKKLIAGLAWIPLGLALIGHQAFVHPILVGLPLGGPIATVVDACLFSLFALSISYAATMALYGAFIGVCFIIMSVILFVGDRVDTSWLEGDVRVPAIPQTLFTAIRGFVAGFVCVVIDLAQIVGEWVTPETSEPSELEKVQEAYAQGELTDLEMEQQIEEAIDEDHDTS